jgi:hypothetical protein
LAWAGPTGAEGALKTYMQDVFFGILLMLGVTVIYAAAGTTSYTGLRALLEPAPAAVVGVGLVGVLAGLMFKAAAVPGHFWVPDAAEGAGTGALTSSGGRAIRAHPRHWATWQPSRSSAPTRAGTSSPPMKASPPPAHGRR